MVIGWRNNRQDGGSRIFVTRILRLVIRICFGVSVKDANTPFRLMKSETLRKYIDLIPNDFNPVSYTHLYRCCSGNPGLL